MFEKPSQETVVKWNMVQASRYCQAVKPWEWLDHPDWYHEVLEDMGISERQNKNRAKRGNR